MKNNKKKINYIDNKLFLQTLIEHRNKRIVAEEQGKPIPILPDYIGECFMKICEGLARKPNFAAYTFKDEMILDGIENCIVACGNFDPEASSNPFGYFTQIVYYAFLRRIKKEKTHLYIKYKATEQFSILDEHDLHEDAEGNPLQFEIYDNMSEFIQTFEDAKKKEKEKKVTKTNEEGLDKFFNDDVYEK